MTAAAERAAILAVDDVDKNLMSLEALVDRDDVVLLKASSGRGALEVLLQQPRVALALIDVQMPEMDGYELAELMRGSPRTRDVPIIFITAAESSAQRTFRGYEAGAVDFIHKPVDPLVLRSKIDIFVRLWRQQQQLSEQLAALHESLRINQLFTAALGHDLRSPLQAVLNGIEMLERDALAATVPEIIRRMRSSGQRMSQMIEQLLELARLRSGEVKLSLQPADLQEIAAQVVGEVSADKRDRVRLEVSGDTRGVWDAVRVAQVVSNLVSNGVQHGAPHAPVQVSIDGTLDHEVRFSVRNAGTIPPEALGRVFEPFFSTGTSHSRLGLGLCIVKQLTTQHGGDIGVTSTREAGTVFDVRLPRVAPPS